MRKDKKVQKKEPNKKNNPANKIIMLSLSILLLTSGLGLGYLYCLYVNLKNDNDVIRNKITNVNNLILNIEQDYVRYTDELNNKKNELKDKIEEYNVWLETIEKVK